VVWRIFFFEVIFIIIIIIRSSCPCGIGLLHERGRLQFPPFSFLFLFPKYRPENCCVTKLKRAINDIYSDTK
jgi:hypothetical protein